MLIDEDMKTDVELLKRDFDLLAGLAEKFDVAIDKLTGVSTAIDKMLAVHDARLNTTEKQTEVIHQRITEENNIQHKSVEARLDKLERWRWVVMGAAAAIGSAVTTLIAFKDLI